MNFEARFCPVSAPPQLARQWAFLAVLLAFVWANALLCTSARAAEEETHIFNAALSLTGDCSTGTATGDPVPDPGCPEGEHPPKPFMRSSSDAVDPSGDRYVLNAGASSDGSEGRVDVFDATGKFLTELPVVLPGYEGSVAVDSEGYLYVMVGARSEKPEERLLRFKPTKYDPAAGEIKYDSTSPVVIPNPGNASGWGTSPEATILVDPHNDHLFVNNTGQFWEFTSAKEGNTLIEGFQREELEGFNIDAVWRGTFGVDWSRERLYYSEIDGDAHIPFAAKSVVRAYPLHSSTPGGEHELLFTIDGSTTPTGRFVSESRYLPVAVDETTGDIFVGDLEAPTRRIYEFNDTGQPVSTIEGPLGPAGVFLRQMAYDNGENSPTQGYLFVPSGNGPAHSLAFEPKPDTGPPMVKGLSANDVTSSDAILHGTVNPNGVETSYRVEYTTEAAFSEHGFEGAALAGEGMLKTANEAVAVSAPVSGLSAGTAYRFRVVAESPEGQDEAESSFVTVAAEETSSGCLNQALRTGPSAALPDCRAYELVTPSDTNGAPPFGTRADPNNFNSRQVSPEGNRLPFVLVGGSLSGLEATGSRNGDPYLATRTASGWATSYEGPSPIEAPGILPGGSSPDQRYSFWQTDGNLGSARLAPNTVYLRYPDGHSELLGKGSLGIDPNTQGLLIAEQGSHILFNSGGGGNLGAEPAVQLEPGAAPGNTRAIYDRAADGILRVVSLKPGDVPFGEGEEAEYDGASLDGVGVAFEVNGVLYLRYDDAVTYEIGESVQFAGVAAEAGNRLFYMNGGDLWRFDANGATTTRFTETGDAVPVNVSADGSTAYFVSKSVVPGSGPNPEGDMPQPGLQNLYRSEEGQSSFVATVIDRDVEGEGVGDGLGRWVEMTSRGSAAGLGAIPARSTPDGRVMLFKSRAPLTGYDSNGHGEIYRYDAARGELQCLSCNPTGAAATADANLQIQEEGNGEDTKPPYSPIAWLENLRADGRRAFFETSESLVAGDTDQLRDVYEWEDEGVGSCTKGDGCVSLISSGQSGRDEFLWAVSKSGDDVFFLSRGSLAGGDTDETPSIYDARVNGGFPAPATPSGECLGEACQPSAVAPNDPTPASAAFQGKGNVVSSSPQGCPKGRRAVRRSGKRRCVPRHTKKHNHARKHDHTKKHAKGNGRAGR
jgi:hypothetical protein